MKKKCIIFGGTGFIGSNLTKQLISKGYNLTVFAHKKPNKKDKKYLNINKVNFIEGDINNTKLLYKIITPKSYIFDLITSSTPSSPVNQVIREIKSHVKLIKICCQKKVKKIIFTSSGGGVYGNTKNFFISELHHLQPSSPHSIGKSFIEYFISYNCRQSKIPFIIYRISNPYGPGQIPKPNFGLIPTLFLNILTNQQPILYDEGEAIRDFIYIDDVTEAITISFFKKNKFPVYNIGYGSGIKTKDILKKIKKITNSKIKPILVSKRAFDVKKYILNNKRFSNEFNWKPKIKTSTGLALTWVWIKQYNKNLNDKIKQNLNPNEKK